MSPTRAPWTSSTSTTSSGRRSAPSSRPCARSIDKQVRPHVAQWYDEASLPARELAVELGKVGLLGMHLEGYGCAGTSATAYGLACLELEAADSGVRSLVSVQGSLAMYAIWKHGSDGAEGGVAAADGDRRGDRLLRADRAGRRLRPGVDAHPGAARRHRLGAQRLEDVDHQRLHRRRRGGLGPDATRRRIRGFVVPTDSDGLQRAGDQAQALAARLGDQRAGAGRRPPARRRGAARGDRAEGSAVLPDRGAVRDHLRLARRGPRQRWRPRCVRRRARDLRPLAGVVPAHPGQARRHDRRARQGDAARAAPRPAQGRRAGSRRRRSASASSTTSARRSPSPASAAPSSAPPASRWSTP